MGLDAETWSLAVGKAVDLVRLDRDFVAGAAEEIIRVQVLETRFAGRRVRTAD